MQDVAIVWEDGKHTIESFKNEAEFFSYLDSVKEDTGIGADDFFTEPQNFSWAF